MREEGREGGREGGSRREGRREGGREEGRVKEGSVGTFAENEWVRLFKAIFGKGRSIFFSMYLSLNASKDILNCKYVANIHTLSLIISINHTNNYFAVQTRHRNTPGCGYP